MNRTIKVIRGEKEHIFNELVDVKEFIEFGMSNIFEYNFKKEGIDDEFCLMIQEDDDLFEEEGVISFDWHSECEFTDKQNELLNTLPDNLNKIISKIGYKFEVN